MPSSATIRYERIRKLSEEAKTLNIPDFDNILTIARHNWPEVDIKTLRDYTRSVLDQLLPRQRRPDVPQA